MNVKSKLALLAIGLTASLFGSGCTWVNLSDNAQKVRVLKPNEVTTCKKKGKTVASVKYEVLGAVRDEKKMATELATIARNEAPELGADTVVAMTPIEQGRRTFYLYKCVDPNGP